MTLDHIQLRVLGALIEKEITTPENYPLSLNSLIAACNQRSSRDPVLDLTEDEVRQAIHSLEDLDIVAPVRDARVPKYEHRIRTVLNLRRDETAILCLLLLRGPQTPGELRGRADRMFSFDDIAAVQSTLERLASRTADSDQTGTGALVVQLARQPGSRESRHAHLLGGPIAAAPPEPMTIRSRPSDIEVLATAMSELRTEIEAGLEAKFGARLAELSTAITRIEARLDVLELGNDKGPAPELVPRGSAVKLYSVALHRVYAEGKRPARHIAVPGVLRWERPCYAGRRCGKASPAALSACAHVGAGARSSGGLDRLHRPQLELHLRQRGRARHPEVGRSDRCKSLDPFPREQPGTLRIELPRNHGTGRPNRVRGTLCGASRYLVSRLRTTVR